MLIKYLSPSQKKKNNDKTQKTKAIENQTGILGGKGQWSRVNHI